MEGLRERSKRKRTRNPRYASSPSPPLRRRSLRHILQPPPPPPPPPEAETLEEFNPCDPYSSAMDNMPLKDLFPNMKVRKRAQNKMIESAELPSPKSIETDESIRCKLRDSLAAALRTLDSSDLATDRADMEEEIEIGALEVDCKSRQIQEVLNKNPLNSDSREKKSHDGTEHVLESADVDCKPMLLQDKLKKERLTQGFERNELQYVAKNQLDTAEIDCNPRELHKVIKKEESLKHSEQTELQCVTENQLDAVEIDCNPMDLHDVIKKEQLSKDSEEKESQDSEKLYVAKVDCKPMELRKEIKEEQISHDSKEKELHGVTSLGAEINCKPMEILEAIKKEHILQEFGLHDGTQLDATNVDCIPMESHEAINKEQTPQNSGGKELQGVIQVAVGEVVGEPMELQEAIKKEVMLQEESQEVTQLDATKIDCIPVESHEAIKKEQTSQGSGDKELLNLNATKVDCELIELQEPIVAERLSLCSEEKGLQGVAKNQLDSTTVDCKLTKTLEAIEMEESALGFKPMEIHDTIKVKSLLGTDEKLLLIVNESQGHNDVESLKSFDSAEIEEPCKKARMDSENMEAEDKKNMVCDLAERIAVDIEAELYRLFGGVNRKYKEKARSLLFNLKDRSNPELRIRVLSGEITPETLCSLSAEQLASKELSEWRLAKAEEFSHMVVLTDSNPCQPRLLKKTHKGEFEVIVEKDDIITEVVTASFPQSVPSPARQATEGLKPIIENFSTIPEIDNAVIEIDTKKQQSSPIRESKLVGGMSPSDNQVPEKATDSLSGIAESESVSQEEVNAKLPTIMTLDEFVGSKKERESKIAVDADKVDAKHGRSESNVALRSPSKPDKALHSSRGKAAQKTVGSPIHKSRQSGVLKNVRTSQKQRKEYQPNEKLWEGSFQLSGCQISPVVAIYKSGDAVELHNWPTQIEIKGRVRLDALEKFLQELPQSRTRAVMITACCVVEDKIDRAASNALKEASDQYQRSHRVGYAEPCQGYELYLFPGGGNSLRLLVNHGYLNMDQVVLEEEGILVGLVVCRKNLIPSSNAHKSSSHYFNANKHALSAQLDSPTRPNEGQWSGNAKPHLAASKVRENPTLSVSLANLQKAVPMQNNSVEGCMRSMANNSTARVEQVSPNPLQSDPMFSWFQKDRRSAKGNREWVHRTFKKEEVNGEDLPPGFGPRDPKRRFQVNDVDDLPEYDFSAQSVLPNIHARSPLISQTYNIQVPFSQSSVPNPLLQSAGKFNIHSETSNTFDQFNQSSHLTRFDVSELRPPLTSESALPSHMHAVSSHPPVGSISGFPHRSHRTIDEPLPARMPNASHPVPNIVLQEHREAFVKLPSGNTPSFLDTSRAESIGVLQELRRRSILPVVHVTTSSAGQNGPNQTSSIWDDDDMPEWCPPALAPEPRDISPHSATIAESGTAAASTGLMPPHIGRGWQRIPQSMLSSQLPLIQSQASASLGRDRRILSANSALYAGSSNRAVHPMSRLEQLPAYRSQSIRPNESRRGSK